MRKLKHKRRKKNEEMCIGLRLEEEGGRCFLINLFKSTAQEASCRTETELMKKSNKNFGSEDFNMSLNLAECFSAASV